MTDTTTEPEQRFDPTDVIRIVGGPSDRDKTYDVVPFTLDDDETVIVGTRPKLAVLIELMAAMNNEGDEMAQAVAFNELLDEVLEDASASYIRGRMKDREDDLDLDSDTVKSMFNTLFGLWYEGPTGGATASLRSPSRTGQRSTGRRPSRAKTR